MLPYLLQEVSNMATVKKIPIHQIIHRYIPKKERQVYNFLNAHLQKQAEKYIDQFYEIVDDRTEDIKNLSRLIVQIPNKAIPLFELLKVYEKFTDTVIKCIEDLLSEEEDMEARKKYSAFIKDVDELLEKESDKEK
jgi:hypothetical protein